MGEGITVLQGNASVLTPFDDDLEQKMLRDVEEEELTQSKNAKQGNSLRDIILNAVKKVKNEAEELLITDDWEEEGPVTAEASNSYKGANAQGKTATSSYRRQAESKEADSHYAKEAAKAAYDSIKANEMDVSQKELISEADIQEIIEDQKLSNMGLGGSGKYIRPEVKEQFELHKLWGPNFLMNRVKYMFAFN